MSGIKLACLWDRDPVCKALKVRVCPGCRFWTTTGHQMDSEEKAFERLRMLPPMQQLYLADKYYQGRMPWQGKGAPRI